MSELNSGQQFCEASFVCQLWRDVVFQPQKMS